MMIACVTLDRLMITMNCKDQQGNAMKSTLVKFLISFFWIIAMVIAVIYTYALKNTDSIDTLPADDCHAIWAQINGREVADFVLCVVLPTIVNAPPLVMFVVVCCQQKRAHICSVAPSLLLILALNTSYAFLAWPLPIYFLLLTVTSPQSYGVEMALDLVVTQKSIYVAIPIILLIFVICDSNELKNARLFKDKERNIAESAIGVHQLKDNDTQISQKVTTATHPEKQPSTMLENPSGSQREMPLSSDSLPEVKALQKPHVEQFSARVTDLHKLQSIDALEEQVISLSSSISSLQELIGKTIADVSQLKALMMEGKNIKTQQESHDGEYSKEESENCDYRPAEEPSDQAEGIAMECDGDRKGVLSIIWKDKQHANGSTVIDVALDLSVISAILYPHFYRVQLLHFRLHVSLWLHSRYFIYTFPISDHIIFGLVEYST